MAPEEFIKQINGKHIAAFRELFSVFYRYLVLYAMRLVRQQEVAEDMVQEVFVAIWESDKEYNSYHGFRAFLYDSVKNKCLNYLKHEEVERRHAELMMRYVEEDDEDYRVMREEMYRELHRAVDELHLQRKKNEEIAQLLKLSVETVKTQKKKAMHTLRERLGKLFDILVALNIV